MDLPLLAHLFLVIPPQCPGLPRRVTCFQSNSWQGGSSGVKVLWVGRSLKRSLGTALCSHSGGRRWGAFCDRKALAAPQARPVKRVLGRSCSTSKQLGSTDHFFYPTQPSLSLPTITDEEIKTGDPRETLRRASMQPAQIAEGAGITTRQQRKRVSAEPHQGPGTPEVGDVGSHVFSSTFAKLISGEAPGSEGGRVLVGHGLLVLLSCLA